MKMKTPKFKGILTGIIFFSVFTIPWLYLIFSALKTDPHGFRAEGIMGIFIGIAVFAFVAAFLGFSVAKKSALLIILACLCILAVPAIWWYFAWLP
jgi:hypothetical protein